MVQARLVLAVLGCWTAWGAAPSYSLAGVVNTGNYSAGPFAPNAIITIFGVDLARSAQTLTAADIKDGTLPVELNFTQVFVENSATPLFYVSPGQINFLMPSNLIPGPVRIRVVREGLAGPEITVTVVNAAPALFAMTNGYAIATHADNSLVSPDSPSHPSEIIVIYATGLGKTVKNPATGELPPYSSQIADLANFKLLLAGTPVDSTRILYCGLSPGSAGLYQVNVILPDNVPADPELRLSSSGQTSPTGLKLAVKLPPPPATQQ